GIDYDEMVDGMYKGLFDQLDRHSVYYTPEEYQSFTSEMSGEFTGVGIQIVKEGNYIVVVTPLKGSPAVEAGIKAKDKIISVDGQDITGFSTEEAAELIRGEVGTSVRLGILRNSEEIFINVIRDVVTISSVNTDMLTDEIGYLEITQFNDNTLELFGEAIGAFDRDGIHKLVIFFLLIIINNFVYSSGLYFQDTSHGHWDPSMKFEKYGYLSSFMYDFNKSLKVDIENYSVKDVDKILSNYENIKESSSRKPNIIVVMNEAFSDLSILGDFETNEAYLSYFNSLQNNTIKGILTTSPVRGSGTGFTEFEFLTGNSMAFLRGTNPYVQYINSDMPSIVSTLKDQNYQALAMHPYKKTSYNRVSVYSHFGFEDYITMENFNDPETVRGNISDLENYKKLIELYENRDKEKSFFIFNITMQNHGGYVDTGYKFNNPIEVTSFEVQEDVNVFLSLMKESDLAFKYLIDYFSEVEEDTIILMFGDHQPMLDNDFLENVYRKPLSDFTLEDKSKLYQVPFIIWSNYDIQENYIENISINYLSTLLLDTAGLKKTTYQVYLSSLREKLPIVVANFYGNPKGEFFSYETDTEYDNYLKEYESIQFNYLFDLKNRLDKYFYLKE
ncbi:MAG: sulfatase-like hydrolase/transferase, partial [Tissierellales bacterium]|nr:sulfatase-like hydrolase/transferase [Tissierellales bacterium]